MPDKKPGTDSQSALTKQNTTPNTSGNIGLARQGTGIKLPGLHARLRAPQVTAGADPLTREHRIALMCDASGSMGGQKNRSLVEAVTSFIQNCDMRATSLAIDTFGAETELHVALSTQQPMLLMSAMAISADGGTPMAHAMEYVINTHSVTRGVLVSDGQPDNVEACYETARMFREAGVMVDCVHIGNDTSGEAVMRRIAEITGGQFIKFTDIAAFSRNFKYLTPAFYGMLTSGGVSANDLGAKELK